MVSKSMVLRDRLPWMLWQSRTEDTKTRGKNISLWFDKGVSIPRCMLVQYSFLWFIESVFIYKKSKRKVLWEQSPSFAVARKKLVKQCLQDLVWNHSVSLSKVKATCGTAVDLCSKGTLQTTLAHIVEAGSCNWLVNQFLAAHTHKSLLNIFQKFRALLNWRQNLVPQLLVLRVLFNKPILLFC